MDEGDPRLLRSPRARIHAPTRHRAPRVLRSVRRSPCTRWSSS